MRKLQICSFIKKSNRGETGNFVLFLKIKATYFFCVGRVVESPHPLKDNYKLKETVHIPGARCLYLKFDSKEGAIFGACACLQNQPWEKLSTLMKISFTFLTFARNLKGKCHTILDLLVVLIKL